jgi:hypothetical protein
MRVPQQAGRPANIINHFVLVVDESLSMLHLRDAVVRVFDQFTARLAASSKDNGQETRVTVYFFGSYGTQRCVIYDMDVLRVPSLEGMYHPGGNTALLQTFQVAMADLREIPQKYGDHSFVVFGWTDGDENDSYFPRTHQNQARVISEWSAALASAPENETYGLFVPDRKGVDRAVKFGFPASNVSIWDSTSEQGIEEAALLMGDVADSYMAARAQGVRGYSARSGGGLFAVRQFSKSEVTSALPPLTQGSYYFLDVRADEPIREFMTRETGRYSIGTVYYQHTKAETIQPQKEIAVEVTEELPGGGVTRVYSGRAARDVLGLPDQHVKARPNPGNGCTVFVQSTSPNRKLIGGTRVLVMR